MKARTSATATLVSVVGGLPLALLLSSCGSPEPGTNSDGTRVVEVDLRDGSSATCVIWDGYRAGSIDCDFK